MGRFTGAKSASDYFGAGSKSGNGYVAPSEDQPRQRQQQQQQQQQQQSGFKRFMSMLKGSQSQRQEEGPSGRAASSFLLAWRSTRGPPDILTLDQCRAASSFAGQPAPRWESVATDVVTAARNESSVDGRRREEEEDAEAAEQERARLAEQERRQQQAAKLLELQRQATLRERPAERLDYHPEPATTGRPLRDTEVLRLGPFAAADGWQQEHQHQQYVTSTTAPQSSLQLPAEQWQQDGQPPRSLQTQGTLSRHALLPSSHLPAQQHLLQAQPPQPSHPGLGRPLEYVAPQPYRSSEPPALLSQDGVGSSNSREQLRLPPFGGASLVTAAAPSPAAAVAALRTSGVNGSQRFSWTGSGPARQGSGDPSWDPAGNAGYPAMGAADYMWGGAQGPAVVPAAPPPVIRSVSQRTIVVDAPVLQPPLPAAPSSQAALPLTPQPALPPRPYMPMSVPIPVAAAAAAAPPPVVVPPLPPLQPDSESEQLSSPPLEVTLLSLAPAAPSSPTMEIILGSGPPKAVDPAAAASPVPPIMRQRSVRTSNGMYGPHGGLGAPTLTAEVALATSGGMKPSPVRRVSTPGTTTSTTTTSAAVAAPVSGGGAAAAAAVAAPTTNDALARRAALLKQAFTGAGSMRRTLQNNLQSMRSSGNGSFGSAVGAAVTAGGSLSGVSEKGMVSFDRASAAFDKPRSGSLGGSTEEAGARAAAPVLLNRSLSHQRESSPAGSTSSSDRPSNWDYWKQRTRDTNWGLWKSQSNLSSRVRHDLEIRAAGELAGQQAGPGSGSGANSPVPAVAGAGAGPAACVSASGGSASVSATASTPRWKQMLEATAAVLDSPDDNLRGSSAGTTAAGNGDDASDDVPQQPRVLARAITMRGDRPLRAVTPAASSGRVLLRAATQPPTMVMMAASAGIDDEDASVRGGSGGGGAAAGPPAGGGRGKEVQFADMAASASLPSPRAGRRAPAPPAARPSADGGATVAAAAAPPPPPPPLLQPALSVPAIQCGAASPRIAVAERARERSLAGSTTAAAPPPPGGLGDGASVAASRALASEGSTTIGVPRMQRQSSPNAASPPLPARVTAGSAHSNLSVPSGAVMPTPPPVPYRVSLMGAAAPAGGGGGAYDGVPESSHSGPVPGARVFRHSDVVGVAARGEGTGTAMGSGSSGTMMVGDGGSSRVSINGGCVNPRSRRMLFAASGGGSVSASGGAAGEPGGGGLGLGGSGSLIMPVPPPGPFAHPTMVNGAALTAPVQFLTRP